MPRAKPRVAIVIRAARPSDKRAIRAICARIWGAHDYVVDVFDEWVRDRRGRLWVAVVDDDVVGIAKLSIDGDEAWLHGLRVDPRHRRQGIATALLRHRLDRARRLGARVARLDTERRNTAVKRMMRRHRFSAIARVSYYDARALAVPPPRRASVRDVAAMLRLARRDGALYHGARIFTSVRRKHLLKAIRDGDCFLAGNGDRAAWAVVESRPRAVPGYGQGDRLAVRAIAGSRGAVRTLLHDVRGEARRRGLSRVALSTRSPLWAAVRAAGYRRRWDEVMLIFEKRLR